MTTLDVRPDAPTASPCRPRFSPAADPYKTVPAVEVDLTGPDPAWPLGAAIGSGLACGAGLVGCLHWPGDLLAQVITAAAFLTCLAACHIHRRLTA